jgi:hypothetical protein
MRTATILKMRWVLTAVLCLALAGCDSGIQYQWNQKYTVTIDTPEGVKSASSVVELTYVDNTENPEFGSGHVHKFRLRGEAIAIKVRHDKYLFVLLTSNGREYDAFEEFSKQLGYLRAEYSKIAPKLQGSNLQTTLLENDPMLVTFDDISKPETVKRVDPKNLAASFGAGYALKSITMEITDEPVTEGRVDGLLGWLSKLKGGYLHGGTTSKGAPLGLHGGDFKRGVN